MSKKIKFHWEKVGRSWVADIGPLSVVVIERGNATDGLRWRVADVFGNKNLGSGWHSDRAEAIAEAERCMDRVLVALDRARAGKAP